MGAFLKEISIVVISGQCLAEIKCPKQICVTMEDDMWETCQNQENLEKLRFGCIGGSKEVLEAIRRSQYKERLLKLLNSK